MKQLGLATATLLLAAGSAVAQTTTEPRTTTQPAGNRATDSSRDQAGHSGNLDHQIAACLHLGNQEEVILAQFAQQKAQNPEVKKFAQMLAEQHQQAIGKIEKAAPELAKWDLKLASNQSPSTKPAAGQGVQPASNTAARNANNAQANYETSAEGGHDKQALKLAKSVKQQCLQLSQEALNEKQGVEFDKAFMGMQVAAHMGMLAQLRGSREFATGELQQVIDEGEQMTEQHLAEAKNIMQQIKDQEGTQPQRTTATQ